MSRSRRKKPCTGITTSESEKQDKRFANRKYRRAVKIRLTAEVENGVLPEMRELTNLWAMDKDGKKWFDPQKFPKLMRK